MLASGGMLEVDANLVSDAMLEQGIICKSGAMSEFAVVKRPSDGDVVLRLRWS